ncbi:hypothetical protein SAMN05421544_10631 [Riemerella columbipharyngis]|uniref:Uncharacterized protein n=1 Tax=Riemerella columbipharyngis TaxID=1071918 RepID=A0A1G7BN91_9FLAO|nr:hypothetical protein SAMN05421544_10631 [Riemerella columbipharyngis]
MITNNLSIRNYDFYNPNNIFIIENKKLEGLEDFLMKKYEVNQEIKEKYSFSNWIKYVLDIKPHKEITLP